MSEATQIVQALRADLDLLSVLLDETLERQEGAELRQLHDQVRQAALAGDPKILPTLRQLDLPTATRLARAFLLYFHLANVAEQVHRWRALAQAREETGGPLARTAERLGRADVDHAVIDRALDGLAARPVFTAHPTEASRRSTLVKLQRIGRELQGPRDAGREAPDRGDDRPDVADGRAAAGAARGHGRGPQRPVLPRRHRRGPAG